MLEQGSSMNKGSVSRLYVLTLQILTVLKSPHMEQVLTPEENKLMF